MEAQLNELIEKIKQDGVKTAEEKAAAILADAKAQADDIIAKAEKDADKIKTQAQNDALRFENSSKEALHQASRNLLIELRQAVETQLNLIVSEEVQSSLKGESLSNIIPQVMQAWAKGDSSDLVLLVPEKELKALEKDLQGKLADQMKKGMEIRPFSDIEGGFRVSSKDGKMFYDFSDEELTKMISRYLNSSLQAILEQ